MQIAIFILVFIVLAVVLALSAPSLGRLPQGSRLAKIKTLPNYINGGLVNLKPTKMKPDEISYWTMFNSFLFGKHPGKKPDHPLPHQEPDFSANNNPKLTWFGHSSYLLQVEGINILVDPVFSKRTSPFSWAGSTVFKGMDFMNVEKLPKIDVVLLTHDHYDHLDHQAILKLKAHQPAFVASLGVGEHLERWGVLPEQITELAWQETTTYRNLIHFRAMPARHFTGRTFKRNQCVWSAFIVNTGKYNLYLGGDSGYDENFSKAGEAFGPFDLAILECGQYNTWWPDIHMFPEQTVQAGKDLRAKVVLPVHWGKYTLAMHPWKEPISRAVKAAETTGVQLTTPMPGEPVLIGAHYPASKWWENC